MELIEERSYKLPNNTYLHFYLKDEGYQYIHANKKGEEINRGILENVKFYDEEKALNEILNFAGFKTNIKELILLEDVKVENILKLYEIFKERYIKSGNIHSGSIGRNSRSIKDYTTKEIEELVNNSVIEKTTSDCFNYMLVAEERHKLIIENNLIVNWPNTGTSGFELDNVRRDLGYISSEEEEESI